MLAKRVNQEALACLANQNWKKAQKLLIENARINPSHETYNNLGYYLISEGFVRKNGKFVNSWRKGMKYLQRAAKLRKTPENLCAIATAYDLQTRCSDPMKKAAFYKKMYELLVEAYSIRSSKELYYNVLRMQILAKESHISILEEIRTLLTNFVCEESVRLYFEMLSFHSLYDEGIKCIAKYGEYLSTDDVLLFYAKHGKYEEGYNLCARVYREYSPDKYISAAIMECCINTNHLEEARIYAQHIADVENSFVGVAKNGWLNQVFVQLGATEPFRKKLISEYRSIPSFLNVCCYFQ